MPRRRDALFPLIVAAGLILIAGLLLLTAIAQEGTRPLRPIEPLIAEPFGIVCTAFSISDEGWWVTAHHCQPTAADDPDERVPLTIAGMDATPIWDLPDDDLLILMTDVGVAGLPLSGTPPRTGDPVHLFGYAFGLTEGVYTEGLVAHPTLPGLNGWPTPRLLVGMPVCIGESGSPIVDRHGEVVSVFQNLTSTPCAPYGIGLTYATLVKALHAVWPPRPPTAP